MNYDLTPTQARAWFFIDHVALSNVDDDLDNPIIPEWPPLLDRRQAARFLGIGMKHLSDLSGNGPKGGRLRNYKVRGQVFWKLVELQAYAQEREGPLSTVAHCRDGGDDGI